MENPFTKLMKRKVVQWATGYGAVGVVVVEVLDVVGGRFLWPEWVLEGGIVLVAYGLLVTLVLAWFHGEKGRQDVGALEITLLTLVVAACALTLWLVRGEGEDTLADALPTAISPDPRLPGGILEPPDPNASRIAVLPFANLSALGEADAYLADGLHDEIITQISKISALDVVSRTSVLKYRDPEGLTAQQIGEELGVWYLLEGTLRRIGDQIRISAQLIDTRRDGHLWAETYDGVPAAAKLFDLQSDVAIKVAGALQAALLPTEITRIARAYTQNDEAYRNYLQGVRLTRGYASVNVPGALEYFTRSVELDPGFALGWEALSVSYMNMGNYFLMPAETAFLLAEEAGRRALDLDPTLSHARMSFGWLEFSYYRNFEAAESLFNEILRDDGGLLEARVGKAYVLQAQGRMGEAVAEIQALTRSDPTSGYGHRIGARILHFARQFEEAERVMRRAMEMVPAATGLHLYQALTLEQMGRFDEAAEELRAWAAGSGWTQEDLAVLRERSAAEGMAGAWDEWTRWHLAAEEPRPGPVAIGFARLGRATEAVEWLNRGFDQYESWLFQLNDPLWDPIRETEGFQDVFRREGLSPAQL